MPVAFPAMCSTAPLNNCKPTVAFEAHCSFDETEVLEVIFLCTYSLKQELTCVLKHLASIAIALESSILTIRDLVLPALKNTTSFRSPSLYLLIPKYLHCWVSSIPKVFHKIWPAETTTPKDHRVKRQIYTSRQLFACRGTADGRNMQMSDTTMQLANRLWVFTYNNYQCREFEHNPIQRGRAMHMEQPKHRLLTLSLVTRLCFSQ